MVYDFSQSSVYKLEVKLKLFKNKMSNACNNLNKQYKLVKAT